MAEIEFTIDTERGTCESEIKGYQGPACEKAAKQLKDILGAPSTETRKQEYFVRPQPKRRIQSK